MLKRFISDASVHSLTWHIIISYTIYIFQNSTLYSYFNTNFLYLHHFWFKKKNYFLIRVPFFSCLSVFLKVKHVFITKLGASLLGWGKFLHTSQVVLQTAQFSHAQFFVAGSFGISMDGRPSWWPSAERLDVGCFCTVIDRRSGEPCSKRMWGNSRKAWPRHGQFQLIPEHLSRNCFLFVVYLWEAGGFGVIQINSSRR